MVGRLHIMWLSIVPTGAALVYLLWMYGWKKPKGKRSHICQKTQVRVAVADCEQSHDNVKSPVVSSGEQLLSSVSNDEGSPATSHVSSGISVPDNVSLSPGSSCTDLKSPSGDKLLSATVVDCEPSDKLATVVNLDQVVAAKVNTCQSVNVIVSDSKEADDTPNADEMMKCPVIDSQEKSTVTIVEDEKCFNNCTVDADRNDDDKAVSDSGCSGNNMPVEGCENGRRDSMGSTSGNSCDSRDTNANKCINEQNHNGVIDDEKAVSTHSFDFPTEMCGRLIGQRGRNVTVIKEKSGAEIIIRPKQYDATWQIVTLEGTFQQVNKALDMIKKKFPAKRFPGIDYDRCLPDVPVLPADVMQLCLPMGVAVEVIVCSVVTPNHVFLQQPTHPTFPSLERQNYHMRMCYSVENVPHLPRPINAGVICSAPVFNDWCRAQVVQSYLDTDEYDLKLVDYGGYLHLPGTSLRQIRSDFMSVPFQAIECYMSSVIPPLDDEEFSPTAGKELEDIVQGCILHCEVTAVEEDGVPYVMLTKVSGNEAVVVNRELVHRGLARWLEM